MRSKTWGWIAIGSLAAATTFSCSSTPGGPGFAGGSASGDDGGANTGTSSSGSSSGSGDGSNGSSNGSSGNGSGAASSSSGSSGGAGQDDGGPSSDAGLIVSQGDGSPGSDPDIAYSVTMTTQSFTVSPGGEVFKCQNFANPFKGQQVDIKTWQSDMPTGSHHMFVFYQSGATDGSIADCSGLQIQPFTFVAQGPHVQQTYPHGVGATIPTSMGFEVNVHFINPGATTLQGQVAVTMYVTKPGVVTQHAGMIFNNNISLSEPADGQPHTFTKSCAIGQNVTILASNSHMHKSATSFTASVNGQTIYQTTQWSDPPLLPPPGGPMQVAAGSSLTWSCTYAPTPVALSFGESVNNIMCIEQSVFYPTTNISSPFIGCSF